MKKAILIGLFIFILAASAFAGVEWKTQTVTDGRGQGAEQYDRHAGLRPGRQRQAGFRERGL